MSCGCDGVEKMCSTHMLFRFVLAHAATMYEAAVSQAGPDEWPALGAEHGWRGLGNTSKQAFIQRACDDVGVPYAAYQAWVTTEATTCDLDLDDLYAVGLP